MTARYGVELEGPHKGLRTLVLLHEAQHSLTTVLGLLARHCRMADHVWVQCQPGEHIRWGGVADIAEAGYAVTVQVREPDDLPDEYIAGVSLVWRIPERYAGLVSLCTHAAYFEPAGGTFAGHETALAFRAFERARYDEDEVWTCD